MQRCLITNKSGFALMEILDLFFLRIIESIIEKYLRIYVFRKT